MARSGSMGGRRESSGRRWLASTALPATALTATIAATAQLSGCAAPMVSGAERQTMIDEAQATVARFRERDPGMAEWLDAAHGYVVFPTVAKGAIGVGGAHGTGIVYEDGEPIGTASLSQGTIGLQLGGQTYSEIIFFQNARALDDFKSGNLAFSAQASAVALTAGASADADYNKGVAVFTIAKGGLMYEVSIGGQKFSFRPFPQ